MKNKKVTISGQKFFYEVCYTANEFGSYEWTEFYKETKKFKVRKYCLFGPLIEKEKPIVLFKVFFDVEDPIRTKSQLRSILEHQVELLQRKEEIKRGELI